jgi:hypothetical protein
MALLLIEESSTRNLLLLLTPLACLVFLFPVAIYCLILARLNRGRHPVMVAGPWDCAGLLFAISGFVLFGGPCFITGLNYELRDLWLHFRFRFLTGNSDQWWYVWLSLWALYFAAVLGGSALLLWRRRLVTSVYNVEPAVLSETLARVLDGLGLEWTRARNRLFIGFRRKTAESQEGTPPSDSAGLPGEWRNQKAVLEVDAFESMRHVTLRWPGEGGWLRLEVESGLARVLREVNSEDNPAGTWFLSIGIFLGAVVFIGIGVFLAVLLVNIFNTFW